MILSTCRKPSRLFAGKKSISSPMLYWRYCKDMQTSYFGYFGHAWLDAKKMIVPTCRRPRCLSASQKYTSSFTSFLRYYILKNHAVWFADNILVHNSRNRILPDWWWNINNNISVYFRLFSRKTNYKIFQKIKETLLQGHFGYFLPKFEQKLINFPGKGGSVSF